MNHRHYLKPKMSLLTLSQDLDWKDLPPKSRKLMSDSSELIFKVIVLGDSGVGKTSYVEQIVVSRPIF